MMVETSPRGITFWSRSSTGSGRISISRKTALPVVRLMLLASGPDREIITGSSSHSNLWGK